MLQDLKNIEKLFIERYNEKARANKAKAATAPKADEHVPRKGKREGGSLKGAPQESPFCQILQVVQGSRRALYNPRYHRMSQVHEGR